MIQNKSERNFTLDMRSPVTRATMCRYTHCHKCVIRIAKRCTCNCQNCHAPPHQHHRAWTYYFTLIYQEECHLLWKLRSGTDLCRITTHTTLLLNENLNLASLFSQPSLLDFPSSFFSFFLLFFSFFSSSFLLLIASTSFESKSHMLVSSSIVQIPPSWAISPSSFLRPYSFFLGRSISSLSLSLWLLSTIHNLVVHLMLISLSLLDHRYPLSLKGRWSPWEKKERRDKRCQDGGETRDVSRPISPP